MDEHIYDRIFKQLEKISEEQESTNVQVAVVLQRLNEVEVKINDINKILRGDETRSGVLTEIAVMKQFFEISSRTFNGEESKKSGKHSADNFVSWAWVVDKLMQPVIIAIILWLLFTVIPHISGGQ